MSILVMLNNYFHDFSVALLFSSLLVVAVIERVGGKPEFNSCLELSYRIYRVMIRFIIGAWIFIIVGGVIRTITYAEYEWSEAAGRGQVAALIVKHILLVSFVVAGTWLQLRLRSRFRSIKDEKDDQ